jgi:pantothenate kinase
LKTILVDSYIGYDVDVDFLNLFVNATVLQSIIVRANPKADQERLAERREQLQLDNRASPDAQFSYTTDNIRKEYWQIKNVRDLYSVDP